METDIRNTVIAAGDEAQYDADVKSLLGRKSILAHILASTVDEFKGMPPEDIVGLIEDDIRIGKVPADPGLTNQKTTDNGDRLVQFGNVDSEMNEGTATYDIVFYVNMRDGLSQIIINVEAQKDEPSSYDILNRAVFYVSRLISSQKERDFKGRNYNDLKRVYSIWICMNMKECIWNHVHLVNDNILADYEWKGKPDMFNIVLLGIPNKLPEHDRKYELHRLLSALLSTELGVEERIDILENEYNIKPESDFRKELSEMCNLSQGILERGIEQGLEQGKKQGLEQGLEQGREQGLEQGMEFGKDEEQKRVIYNMNNQGLDADSISRFTGLAIEKVNFILTGESMAASVK